MTAAEALAALERKLVEAQRPYNADAEWGRWADNAPPSAALGVLRTGFEAGYNAALQSIRKSLAETQTDALRG